MQLLRTVRTFQQTIQMVKEWLANFPSSSHLFNFQSARLRSAQLSSGQVSFYLPKQLLPTYVLSAQLK